MIKKSIMKQLLIVIALLVLLPYHSFSQLQGVIDSTFGTNGIVISDFSEHGSVLESTAIQQDGKIIATGYLNNSINDDILLIRYNENGSLDSTFGAGGFVTTQIDSFIERAYKVDIQTDNKILVAGYCDSINCQRFFFLARYEINGLLDTSFASNGKLVAGEGSQNAKDFAIQDDGKIVLVGTVTNSTNDFALYRFDTNGSLDTSFASSGKVVIDIDSGSQDVAYATILDADERILVAGASGTWTDTKYTLLRFNTNGVIDSTFGTNGIITTDIDLYKEYPKSINIQSTGKIIVSGSIQVASGYDIAIVRYNSNGSLDTSFAENGKLIFSGNRFLSYSEIQPDDKIIGGGKESQNAMLFRINPEGDIDTTFGSNGFVYTDLGSSNDHIKSLCLLSNGHIIAGAYVYSPVHEKVAIIKYLSDLNVTINDFSTTTETILVYPNPIDENATLEFEIDQQEEICISLFDLNGKIVRSYVHDELKRPGKHTQHLVFPSDLVKGVYILSISSKNGHLSIQVIKN